MAAPDAHVHVQVPTRRRVFRCGRRLHAGDNASPPVTGLAEPGPPTLLSALLQRGTFPIARPTELHTDEAWDWCIREPPFQAWRTFLGAEHPVLQDDGPAQSISPTVTRKTDASARDVFRDSSSLPLDLLASTSRREGVLAWHPAWAHLEGAPPADAVRLAAVALALTAAGVRALTVEVPPSVPHLQRWLDLLWALEPCWNLNMPVLTLRIRGDVSAQFQSDALALFLEPGGPMKTHAPVDSIYWPFLSLMCDEFLHVEVWPTKSATALLTEPAELHALLSASSFLASYSICASPLDDSAEVQCPATS